MSLANKITLARAVLIIPTLVCLLHDHRVAALLLFGFACTGDVLDGVVARARNEITTWGKVLDPTVDKALYVSLVSALYVLDVLPVIALILFVIPPVAMALGAIALGVGKRTVQSARYIGKAAAFSSFLSLGFLIMRWPAAIELFYVAIGATYVASVDYLRGALRLSRSTP